MKPQKNNIEKKIIPQISKDANNEEVKPEDGVLTFYVELQDIKVEEKGLSDSGDDDE